MKGSTKRWSLAVAAAALLMVPAPTTAQTPPQTPPATQPTTPAQAPSATEPNAAAQEHLAKATAALNDIQPAALNTRAKAQVAEVKRRISALEQMVAANDKASATGTAKGNANWGTEVAAIDKTLTALLGPEPTDWFRSAGPDRYCRRRSEDQCDSGAGRGDQSQPYAGADTPDGVRDRDGSQEGAVVDRTVSRTSSHAVLGHAVFGDTVLGRPVFGHASGRSDAAAADSDRNVRNDARCPGAGNPSGRAAGRTDCAPAPDRSAEYAERTDPAPGGLAADR